MSIQDFYSDQPYPLSKLCQGSNEKPLEIYFFIDPLCPECWALEPIVKKLQIEYGQFFTLKHVLSGRLAALNLTSKQKLESIAHVWERTASQSGMSCDGTVWLENPVSSPHLASIAIKAAGLQGKQYGIRFLRKVQEVLFLEKQNVSDEAVLVECAKSAGLDIAEFARDLHSQSSAKAFQCDLNITAEMDVHEIPTLVFFNENVEEEGIKITGCYPYETYVQILQEMLGSAPARSSLPPLHIFLQHFKFVATKEVAVVYEVALRDAERELKKLQLQQVVEQVPVKYGTFWRYIGQENKKGPG